MTTLWWCPKTDAELTDACECVDSYPIGDEPGVDVLPDGREVTVYTRVSNAGYARHHTDPRGGFPAAFDDGHMWTTSNSFLRLNAELAAVRLLVGLKP